MEEFSEGAFDLISADRTVRLAIHRSINFPKREAKSTLSNSEDAKKDLELLRIDLSDRLVNVEKDLKKLGA
jgi:hypothetical protein